MSDLDPVALFFIARESLGGWLWPLIGVGVLLLAGILAGVVHLRRAGRPMRRLLLAAAVAGALATVAALLALPAWTGADLAAFAGPVDYAIAVLMALVPGVAVAAFVFTLAAFRCRARAIAPA